jgi:hypothetical protein
VNFTVTPNQDDIQTALGTFLTGILNGVDVITGQVNRVPEPSSANFAVMWAINRNRLSTNIDSSEDVLFTASTLGTLLTVTAVQYGELQAGLQLFAAGLAANTLISNQVSGTPGGIGTYTITPSQNVGTRTMAAGFIEAMQPTEVVVQIDVHGPSSADNVQIISTLFRDPYGVDKLHESNPNITPLFTSDPRQIPFANAEQQIETRWIIEAHLQVNQQVLVPQQFADVIEVDLINVDATYPLEV